jgi:outer membrane protein OmpA-like peptidoglycan-associated protein
MMRLAGAALVLVFASGCYCGARIIQTSSTSTTAGGAPPVIHDIIGLLADPETRRVGRVVVSSPLGGAVELTKKREATRVVVGQPPHSPFRFEEDQIQQLFGDALAALPPAPRHFELYFQGGSNQLSPKSEQLLTVILAFVKSRSVPDVSVIGDTDTTGSPQDNIELGRARAILVRDLLVAAGLDASLISVASHGGADLLVHTPDNTPELKNRRVDVSVR